MQQQMKNAAKKWLKDTVDTEETDNDILPVDCVFEGKTEFPKSYYNTDTDADEE